MNIRLITLLLFTILVFSKAVAGDRDKDMADFFNQKASELLSVSLDSALNFAIEAKEYSKLASYNYGLAKSNYILGYIYDYQGKLDKAAICYFESIRYLEQCESDNEIEEYKVLCFMNIGSIFVDHYQYEQAIEYYNISLKNAESHNLSNWKLEVTYRKATAYKRWNKHIEALDNFFEASKLGENQKNYKKLVHINQQLGLLFHELKDYSKSRDHYFNIFNYQSELDNFEIFAGRTCHNIAFTYLEEKNYLKADEYYQKAIDYKTKTGNTSQLFITYMDLGELYLETNQFDMSQEYFEKALGTNTTFDADPEKFKIYKQLSTLYGFLGDAKKFAEYNTKYTECLEKHLKTSEELAQMDQQYNIQLVTQRYFELVESQKRMAALKKYGGFAVAGILSFILIFLIVSRIRKTRLKKSLEQELKEAMQGLDFDL